MSNPEHFRVDCLIHPFEPRIINGLAFEKAFDNPLKPTTPTGLHYVGPLHAPELALYQGLDDVFPITRLGVDEVSALEAHEKLKADRAAEFVPRKAVAAPAPKPAAEASPPPEPEGQGEGNDDQAQKDDTAAATKAPTKAEAKAAKGAK